MTEAVSCMASATKVPNCNCDNSSKDPIKGKIIKSRVDFDSYDELNKKIPNYKKQTSIFGS